MSLVCEFGVFLVCFWCEFGVSFGVSLVCFWCVLGVTGLMCAHDVWFGVLW